MGSLSAMSSIDRVLEKHGQEIMEVFKKTVPKVLEPVFDRVELQNCTYSIGVMWVFKDGSTLAGPAFDIDLLASAYPDCEVGY